MTVIKIDGCQKWHLSKITVVTIVKFLVVKSVIKKLIVVKNDIWIKKGKFAKFINDRF